MKNIPLVKDIEMFLDDKPSVYALRQKARSALEKVGFPNKKSEAWKYTDVEEILNKDFGMNCEVEDCCCGEDCGCREKNGDDIFINLRICNGKVHLEDYNLPQGVRVVGLPDALFEGEYKRYLYGTFDVEKHPFGALNGVYLCEGLVIEVEKNVKCLKPLVICYQSDKAKDEMFCIHNLIIVGRGAALEVVEEYKSNKENCYFMNVVNEFYLDNDSICKHYKVQKDSRRAYNIGLNAVKVYKNAKYLQYFSVKGAKVSRNETFVELEKNGANAEVYSMYKANNGSLVDITTNVNHNVEATISNQYAKAVLEEGSKACFQGKVRIEKNAIKSVGNQLHKALYLGDGAELNCKPELEIYADDVKCSHGASSGEIDIEQLFYLTSRGIGEEEAKEMLVEAHLEEILSFIENEQIKNTFFM